MADNYCTVSSARPFSAHGHQPSHGAIHSGYCVTQVCDNPCIATPVNQYVVASSNKEALRVELSVVALYNSGGRRYSGSLCNQ